VTEHAPLVAFWRGGLRTDSAGRLTLRVPLPPGAARWRVEALAAAGATRVGAATIAIAAPQPVAGTLELPPALTVGDLWPATATLRNGSGVPTLVTATLRLRGLQPATTEPLTRVVRLEPGDAQRLSWPVVTGEASDVEVRVTLETAGGWRQELTGRLDVRASGDEPSQPPTVQTGATIQRDYYDPASGRRLDPSELRAGQLVGVRVSVVAVRPLGEVSLRVPLAGGFAPLGAGAGTPGELRASLDTSGEGIYTQEFLVRAALPGHFIAPAPQLVLANGQTIVGRSEHTIVE
jgi:uncharacterized protein YfaS (alpha-2-macroglobulin family)